MEKKYNNDEILEAINLLLNKTSKEKIQAVPADTEKIISEAEKYLKNDRLF